MMRFNSMADLQKAISPDVVVVGQEKQSVAEVRKVVQATARTILEDRFLGLWRQLEGPELTREHRFHPVRNWRLDFADVGLKLAYEVQGGLYNAQSGHRSMQGVMRDSEKLNAALLLGWRVFQINTEMMKDAEYIGAIIEFHKTLAK